MNDWTKVVTNPLGLAGFALFLVFSVLARVKRQDERRWLSPLAMTAAFVALLGGLAIAYVHVPMPPTRSAETSKAPSQQQTDEVKQSTRGAGSPAVQGVHGDVTITIDQTSGQDKPQKPAAKMTLEQLQFLEQQIGQLTQRTEVGPTAATFPSGTAFLVGWALAPATKRTQV